MKPRTTWNMWQDHASIDSTTSTAHPSPRSEHDDSLQFRDDDAAGHGLAWSLIEIYRYGSGWCPIETVTLRARVSAAKARLLRYDSGAIPEQLRKIA